MDTQVFVTDAAEVISAVHGRWAAGSCDWASCCDPADVVIVARFEVRGLCDRHARWQGQSLNEIGCAYFEARHAAAGVRS